MQSCPLEMWVSVVGVVIGVVGICLAFYFYRRSIRKPKPMYDANLLRMVIVNPIRANARGLEVWYNGQPVTNSAVTATTVYFWNDGRAPIRRADVLSPYVIELDEPSEIIDCSITNFSRKVCGFVLSDWQNGNCARQVGLEFDVVEKDDSVAIQIIHTGDLNTRVRLTGTCIESNEPSMYKKPTTGLVKTIVAAAMILMLVLVHGSITGSQLVVKNQNPFSPSLPLREEVASFAFGLVIVGVMIWAAKGPSWPRGLVKLRKDVPRQRCGGNISV